ncbi:MAG: hypothetical protein V1717_02745 [Candidatus Micrarchaeota archaeon]
MKLSGTWKGNEFEIKVEPRVDQEGPLIDAVASYLKQKGILPETHEKRRLVVKKSGEIHEILHEPGLLRYRRR